ncbi:MAG: recombinase family protein [Candidatus Marinimicrobia bacterium]|nr:recombinase family protein [Candidatus Neomarinimicrobiota bacterium]
MNIGLIRVSSIAQKDNTSIANQERMIREYCSVYNIEIHEIIEEVVTGTTSHRDGLIQLKQMVEHELVETVVVMKLDRLMRSFSEGVVFIKYLLDHDVQIVSVLEQLDTSSVSGRFFMNVLLSMSEMERDTIVQRLNTGKANKFSQKHKVAGRLSFGYHKENGEISISHEEAKIVKYIFDTYLKLTRRGYSKIKRMRILKDRLKQKGYRYKGVEFSCQNIRYILQNKFYIGKMTWGNSETDHEYGRVVSTRMFNLVNGV